MADDRSTLTGDSESRSLRTCPDCGGILEPTRPRWTTMVGMVAGTRDAAPAGVEPPTIVSGWQCLICGYKN